MLVLAGLVESGQTEKKTVQESSKCNHTDSVHFLTTV